MNVDRWVDDRLASLNSGYDPRPNAARVLARLQNREQSRRIVRGRVIRLGIVASVACLALAAIVTIRHFNRDSQPVAIISSVKAPVAKESQPVVARPAVIPDVTHDAIAIRPHVANSVRPPEPVLIVNFKETGSPAATVSCEIYTDYECPPCAAFYRDTIPLLVAQYVETGKVRLLRRDFPLPQHQHAVMAARYADAAGLIGQYETVTDRIFQTQNAWKEDGDIDSRVAAVLSPESMGRLRELMKDTTALDEMIAHDRALGADDHVDQTPTVVIVANGKRQRIAGTISFAILEQYLNEILARQQ